MHAAAIVLATLLHATLTVDARDAPRRILHARLTLPVSTGPLTLRYPKWIPGEHGPTGPISDTAGIRISVAGKNIPWRRDLVEMYAIHCTVPDGADSIEVNLDYLSGTSTEGFTDGPAATSQLAFIDWHLMLLYPASESSRRATEVPSSGGTSVHSIPDPADLIYEPTLTLPRAWNFGSALALDRRDGQTVKFAPVSLVQLIDSPVAAAAHLKHIELTPGQTPPHFMELIADSDAALNISETSITHYKNLVAEAAALFSARHYTQYHFLCTLSDHMSHFGLEHHQCSDDRMSEKAFTDEDELRTNGSLLSHEYTHSWNGKYRRPADLATPDYLQPERTDLLWVYEGLTEYYGDVLGARCGNWTPEDYRENLALVAARMDYTSGRRWRPLQDTADASPFLYEANGAWENWRRGTDFYDEGELIWLEADTYIRAKTNNQKSLDDFCKLFHGPGPQHATLDGEAPTVSPYTFDDVTSAMSQIAMNDWSTFFRSRLDATTRDAPKTGIANGGWKLVYNDAPNAFMKGDGLDLTFGMGCKIKEDGTVSNIVYASPADKGGLGPAMKIVAVGGRRYTPDVMKAALKSSKTTKAFIELLVQNDEFYSTLHIDYQKGERYPHLERDESKPDLLTDIIKPHAQSTAATAPAKDMQP
jgi:predicted metalloprotease with PDZ domain